MNFGSDRGVLPRRQPHAHRLGDKTARLWDAQTGTPIGTPHGHGGSVWAVAFSPDGHTALTGSDDGSARLWDTHTGAAIGETHAAPGERVFAVAFSPDGHTALTGSEDRSVRLWPIPSAVSGDARDD